MIYYKPNKSIAKKADVEHKVVDNNKLNIYRAIKEERGGSVADYISEIEALGDECGAALDSDCTLQLDSLPNNNVSSLIITRKLNDIKHLNAFFQLVNTKLEREGHFLCCLELKNTRKDRMLSTYPRGVNRIIYGLDYFLKRLLPKMRLTKGLHFSFSKGYNRVLTYTEILGRLYASGFELMSKKQIGGLHYLQLRKVGNPDPNINKNYGLFVKLSRVGKNGKMINVYKLRTMHPYSEYIFSYVSENQEKKPWGKLVDDFRVTSIGQFFRRCWIDELPMLLNLLKGELKLVGVRPLSHDKYDTYPVALQQKRIHTKPGLVPPYYADLPKKEEELWLSEDRYLDAYFTSPWRTDWNYFWKAMHNILVKRERSS